MFRSTMFFLVILRLAIGWHFLFEGLEKIRTIHLGPSETNRPFSSAGYFREAPGPMGAWMRPYLGDPYEQTRDRFLVLKQPERDRVDNPAEYLPPALNRDWDDTFNRFVAFYDLDEKQKEKAQETLLKAKQDLLIWLTWNDRTMVVPDAEKTIKTMKKVKKIYPGGEIEIDATVPERVADYLVTLDEVRQMQPTRMWTFGKDVEKQRLIKAKADLESKRADLMKDLDTKTATMKGQLAEVLTADQKAKGAVPAPKPSRLLTSLDVGTAWGLTVLGGFLLLGLLTRFSSVLLAGFLLMTYLAVPPFPWLPVPPNTEGNYFYVNKNLIELLALLVLATVPTGRWLGLDALFHAIRGGDKPVQPATTTTSPAHA